MLLIVASIFPSSRYSRGRMPNPLPRSVFFRSPRHEQEGERATLSSRAREQFSPRRNSCERVKRIAALSLRLVPLCVCVCVCVCTREDKITHTRAEDHMIRAIEAYLSSIGG